MQVQCPVCYMRVDSDHLAFVYKGMTFAFCSEQCRERFQAMPHLYIGVPGHKAAKQEGQEVLKHRCFRLDGPLSVEQGRLVADAVSAMMGIKAVVVDGREIRITYDLLVATAEQVEQAIMAVGARLGGDWTEHLRRALVHYTEECETANLEVEDGVHRHH